MNIRYCLLIPIAIILLHTSCKKNSSTPACTDAVALNVNQPGPCTYAQDSIFAKGIYNLVITKYTLDPGQVGTQFYLLTNNSTCYLGGVSLHSTIDLHWNTGYFEPFDYCIQLNGYSFTIPDSVRNFTWAGAPVTGSGNFLNHSFYFSGIVHSSYGDSVIEVKSY